LSILLPLFPLDLVLFPGGPLPLHIFEPRYREMVSECLVRTKPFGVVRAKEEGIAETGCTAEIISVLKKYDDGRLDIVTQGRERFEVVQINQERAFLQQARAIALHAEVMKLAGSRPVDSTEIQEQLLSFHLAGSLPLDLDFKQTLLEMRSEHERVRAVIGFLEALLPNLRRTVHVRQKAGGNGHAG
jgi:Lon protease-like protein